MCLLLVCKRYLRCIGSSGRILSSAGKDGRYDGSAPDAPRTLQCYSYPMRLPAPARVATYIQPPASDCVRSIDRELGASRVVGGVAGRWQRRRRPILVPMHAAPMLCSPIRLPAPPFSNVPRAIHRELGASRLIGRVARRWRRRPILTNQASACAWCTRCIGSSGRILASAGKDGHYDYNTPRFAEG